jgi:Transglycosylase SLT domain/SPOR domain
MKIRGLATFAFFLGLVVSNAHAEALNPAAPLAVETAADGRYAAGGYRLRDAAARLIAQSSIGQVNDFQNRELDASETTAPTASFDPVCHTLTTAADANGLPLEFLTRLIWQESRFDPGAVSRAGAQGVAQFMPKTAVSRGLANPFDPIEAITKSAELLRDLKTQFGNLGLAAAAYNAGPKRVQDWLARRRSLPRETQAYVRIVTGRSAEEWTAAKSSALNVMLPDGVPCPQIAKLFTERHTPTLASPSKSEVVWAVQLIGDASETNALAAYYQLQKRYPSILGAYQPLVIQNHGKSASWYRVRIGTNTRESAERLCSSLRAAGGSCLVQRN